MQPVLHVDVNNDKYFPNFRRPKVIGYIGLENLKFGKLIQNKNVSYDLNLHLDKAIHKQEDLDVKLNDLLKFLLEHEVRLNIPKASNLDASIFFCYRGLLTCIACTPYENREPWKIVAILFQGNIYLCLRETEEKLLKRKNMTDQEKRFTSWGYKFEQYVLSDSPDKEPDPDQPVDETEEFSLVYTTNLNKHKIIYGAEMDGIRCDQKPVGNPPTVEVGAESVIDYLSTKQFIEIKTNRHIEFPNQERNFRRFKARKWWCQSFLAAVDTILCGFRNDNGIVEELKVMQLNDLPKMSQRFWSPNVCFNFLETFLTYVKRCFAREIKLKYNETSLNMLQSLPMVCLLFEWTPGMPVQVTRNYSHEDDPILTSWFVEKFGQTHF